MKKRKREEQVLNEQYLGYGIDVMGNETSYDTGAITSMIVSAFPLQRDYPTGILE